MNKGGKQLKGRPRGKPWPSGVSGNPKGRPRGALNRLTLAVKGGPFAVNIQEDSGQKPEKYDPRRAHEHRMDELGGVWRRTIEQDGRLFDRDTGFLLSET